MGGVDINGWMSAQEAAAARRAWKAAGADAAAQPRPAACITMAHFREALQRVKPSVRARDSRQYEALRADLAGERPGRAQVGLAQLQRPLLLLVTTNPPPHPPPHPPPAPPPSSPSPSPLLLHPVYCCPSSFPLTHPRHSALQRSGCAGPELLIAHAQAGRLPTAPALPTAAPVAAPDATPSAAAPPAG